METVITVSAFLGAAVIGMAGNARIASYLVERRWLRVTVLAAAFFAVAAIVTGGLPRP